ncbi:MAG: right-handed parallel beta-helix repeat-containing protein [Candidatus Moranbacteria bacterium]|nr:right-handed parallel beta-helix repeat-containing protein [Candidatus Moranbacteria bacterium]
MERKNSSKNRNILNVVAGALLLCAIVIVPTLSFAKSNEIYVDNDSKGKEDGSKNHPYTNIEKAIQKADSGDKIFVSSGTYKVNITLPKDVDLIGKGKNKVTLKGDDKDDPVVIMSDKSKIDNVEIEGGKHGIVVKEGARAKIYNVRIKDSRREGIIILKGRSNDDERVELIDSSVKESGRSGIYAQNRKLVFINNNIHDNNGNGVVLEDDMKAYLEKNTIRNNDKTGVVVDLDESEVTFRNNDIIKNGREGVEINAKGANGYISFHKDTITGNGMYGIALLERRNFPRSLWNSVQMRDTNTVLNNKSGNISQPIRTY